MYKVRHSNYYYNEVCKLLKDGKTHEEIYNKLGLTEYNFNKGLSKEQNAQLIRLSIKNREVGRKPKEKLFKKSFIKNLHWFFTTEEIDL